MIKFVWPESKGKSKVMARLKKIRVLSLAKLQGILWVYVGLLCGILYSFGGFIYDLVITGSNPDMTPELITN